MKIVCDKLDIDYDKVIEYAQHDDRLGKTHWSVPGPDGDLGFGGHCFPKDTQALMYLALTLNVNPTMLAATLSKNDEVREERDWEEMEGRAVIKRQKFEELENFASLEDMRNGIETHIEQGAPRRSAQLRTDQLDFSDPDQTKLKL